MYGVETTETATSLWDASDIGDHPTAFVFGNELIGVDVDVLRECDGQLSVNTYGIKNSLNIATCVGVVVWEALRRLKVSN